MPASARVDEFEAVRPQLLSVAYRLTGIFADAEDVVQDAWLRFDGADGDIADPRAWLTTVVSRLALDRLRSAARRREAYVGQWLPEPMVTGCDDADPLSVVVAHEDARYAAMVLLERLSPDQRVAFVLHDGFAVPFAEVADVLGTSAAAARQLASRARRAVACPPSPPPPRACVAVRRHAAKSGILRTFATGSTGATGATGSTGTGYGAAVSSSAHGTRQASPELKPCSVMPSAEYIRDRIFSTPI